MIRYSCYGSTNYPRSAWTYLDPLEAEYRELLELRERVEQAEAAAAKRIGTLGKRRPTEGVHAGKAHFTNSLPPRAASLVL
jgi:hypothetical protein